MFFPLQLRSILELSRLYGIVACCGVYSADPIYSSPKHFGPAAGCMKLLFSPIITPNELGNHLYPRLSQRPFAFAYCPCRTCFSTYWWPICLNLRVAQISLRLLAGCSYTALSDKPRSFWPFLFTNKSERPIPIVHVYPSQRRLKRARMFWVPSSGPP